jgi:hypothetical protein
MSEKPNNFEFSSFLEQSQEFEQEIADTNRIIAENKQYIEELIRDRELAEQDNEFAREYGYAETDIIQLDALIQEIKDANIAWEKINESFTRQIQDFKRLHEKTKKFLEEHKSDKIN